MSNEIRIICELAGCSEEDAGRAWEETYDIADAVDKLLPGKPPLKKTKVLSEEQQKFSEIRNLMKHMDAIKEASTLLNQPDCVERVEQQDPHEGMVLQNNCSQRCQIPSLGEAVEIQGTVCQSQSECFCDSQSNVQK